MVEKNNFYDVIVVGGGPAGVISAVTLKKLSSEKKVLLIKSVGDGVIPCGIPYMFKTLKKPEDNAMGNAPLDKNNVELKVDEVTEINKKEKRVFTEGREVFSYKKLVLAVGSNPIVPPIPGVDKKGVYCVKKQLSYLKKLSSDIKKSKDVVIIGGGFIGVEFADELSKIKGLKVSLVELLPEVLSNSFDREFSVQASECLKESGVNVYTGVKAREIKGEKKVSSVLLSDGVEIKADLVILGIGSSANVSLAESCGLKTNDFGICVDKFLRTSDKDIFAVGDCCEKKSFFSKKNCGVMLASTATTEARIAARRLSNYRVLKNDGTIACYSTKINSLSLGSSGLTEKTAVEEGFKIIKGVAECPDKHPGKLPGCSMMKVKLVFSERDKKLIGGQVSGGDSVGEMINVVSLLIQEGFSLDEIDSLQIATHPKLTPAPTIYPIISAAQSALESLRK